MGDQAITEFLAVEVLGRKKMRMGDHLYYVEGDSPYTLYENAWLISDFDPLNNISQAIQCAKASGNDYVLSTANGRAWAEIVLPPDGVLTLGCADDVTESRALSIAVARAAGYQA